MRFVGRHEVATLRWRRIQPMTRSNQKLSERQTLDGILAALGLQPDQVPDEGEAPDFTMVVSGHTVGVEITMYQSGDMLDDGKQRRQAESEWDRLKLAADKFRNGQPALRDINAYESCDLLNERSMVPPRRDCSSEHPGFVEFAWLCLMIVMPS
jgi:hypothetical protein